MGIWLKYRDYRHALGEPSLVISKSVERNNAGEPIVSVVRWDVSGWLIGTVTTLPGKIAALEAAYSRGGGDAVLLGPDGKAIHALRSAGAMGGVQIVTPVSYPVGEGVELVTRRTFNVSLEARYPLASARNYLIDWTETLSFSGGGPVYGHQETLNGPPIKQQLRVATIYRATQSGSAEGFLFYPSYPAPIWPNALMRSPQKSHTSPRKNGQGSDAVWTNYKIQWAYEFESVFPLNGQANAR